MKKFFVAALVLCSAVVNAAEVTVLDAELHLRGGYRTDADARFQMDTRTQEGFAKVSVVQERTIIVHNPYPYGYPYPGNRYPYPYPHPFPDHRFPQTRVETIRVFDEMVKVEGLSLVGDKVMYNGEAGEVDCGTLGRSRVFKVPTIYLTGNCKLDARVVNHRVVVKLVTK